MAGSSTDSDMDYDPTRDEPGTDFSDEDEEWSDDELAADIGDEPGEAGVPRAVDPKAVDPSDRLWNMVPEFHTDKRPYRRPAFTGKPAGIAEGVDVFEEQADAFYAFFTVQLVTALCVWCNKRAAQFF